jgi:hypothetical protein
VGLRVLVLEGREIELATNDRPRLGRYVAGADADVRVVDGAPGRRRCAFATAAGEIIMA